MPVNITGGASESRNGAYYGVPKRDLVTGMQVLLQSGGLQIAAGIPYGAALVEEMAEMRAKVTAAGNTQFGAWREGAHDDLVLAVALARWAARKKYLRGPHGAAEYWKRTEQGGGLGAGDSGVGAGKAGLANAARQGDSLLIRGEIAHSACLANHLQVLFGFGPHTFACDDSVGNGSGCTVWLFERTCVAVRDARA
jgi:hypothetical protein